MLIYLIVFLVFISSFVALVLAATLNDLAFKALNH